MITRNEIFKKYLKHDSIVLNIGSFNSLDSINMAKYAGNVCYFEKDKQKFSNIFENVKDFPNITLFNVDIGSYYNIDDINILEPIHMINLNVKDSNNILNGAKKIINRYRPIIITNKNDNSHDYLLQLDYINEYVYDNISLYVSKINYFNMFNWTNDLPYNSKKEFENILLSLNHLQNCKLLEIGTFAGTSIINMLKMLPNATATTIDRWQNYDEFNNNKSLEILNKIKENNVENVYFENIKTMNFQDRVETLKGESRDMLLTLIKNNHQKYNFIYVDGSHRAFDCFLDCELSWELLEKEGILAIDDYTYKMNEEHTLNTMFEKPFDGVNEFLERHKNEYITLIKNYRVFIKKII